jgi:hypothetical protein
MHACIHTHIAIPCSHTTNFPRSPIEIVSNDPGSRDRSDTGTRKEAAKRKKGKTGGANVPSSGPRVYVCVHCAVDDDTVHHHHNNNDDDDRSSGGVSIACRFSGPPGILFSLSTREDDVFPRFPVVVVITVKQVFE